MSKLAFERIYKELAEEEGKKYGVYRCTAGHRTIGIGHNLDAEGIDHILGRSFSPTSTLSETDVQLVFKHDVEKVVNELDEHMSWWTDLPVFAQYVLISLTFNMGIGGILKFVNTIRYLRDHDWKNAAKELKDSKWYKQVGKRGPKIIGILQSGKFPDGKDE